MTYADIFDGLLKGVYPVPMLFSIVIVFLFSLFIFRKSVIRDTAEKIGLARKEDIITLDTKIDDKVEALDAKIEALDAKIDTQIQSLKENDLYHTNKALLILAKYLVKDDQAVYERIKDCILETTPECKKEDIKSI